MVSDTDVVLSAVESNPYAIGYLSHSSLSSNVKSVSINGTMPVNEDIISENCPLTRTFYLVTRHEVDELIQDFINFTSTNSTIIKACGYIPL